MSRRINVRGIIRRDGTLFAVRHRRPEGERDFWCTPGGGLEDGESLVDGIRREMMEETGVTPEIGRLLFIQQFSKTGDAVYDEFLEFFFEITNTDDFDRVDLASTTHGTTELAEFGWVDPRTVDFLPEFLQSVDFASLDHQSLPLIFDELVKTPLR